METRDIRCAVFLGVASVSMVSMVFAAAQGDHPVGEAMSGSVAADSTAPIAAPVPLAPLAGFLCQAPWFQGGARVQMEADGAMPMTVTMSMIHTRQEPDGCQAQLDIRSKSALSALMGPPVTMDQSHYLRIARAVEGGTPASIESPRAIINAQGKYARMFGEASFVGHGVFSYAGMTLREGSTIEGQQFESSLSLLIYRAGTDELVSTLRAQRASIYIGSRHVGRRQSIDTALGPRSCLPITYEKRTSIGPLILGEEVIQTEPTVMQVTEWYCPGEAFVLRTEIRQNGKVQRIDVTSVELPGRR